MRRYEYLLKYQYFLGTNAVINSSLEFETEEHYGFVVIWSGSDYGEVRVSSRVTFIINNDNTFSQVVYRAKVTEDAEPGSRRNLY